jgi:hypothetical protein
MRTPLPARIVVKVVMAPGQPLGSIMPPRPFGSMTLPVPAWIVVLVVIAVSPVAGGFGRWG